MDILSQLEPFSEQIYSTAVSWRRYLHQYPEISFAEQKTSAWIEQLLLAMGCEVKRCNSNHGLIVSIKGDQPGPVIALRADMDALPVQDEKDVEYASKVPGVMHACGHDAHTAALLSVAQFYMERTEQLKGERRLLFQPAEELAPGGANAMISEGALDGVEVIYGVHVWTPLPYGKVATKSGDFMSAVDDFTIEVQGLGGHGGMPHHSIDSIIIGSQIVQALQTIVSRSINPVSPAVVTVGTFQAGQTNNVIAERCLLKGTIRTFDESSRELARQQVERIARQICELHGASCRFELKVGYPALINDEKEAERVMQVAEVVVGQHNVERTPPIMIAEDFAYYLKGVPGCFMFVGAGNEAVGATYSHHHPKFNIDERSMKVAVRMLITTAEHYANERF